MTPQLHSEPSRTITPPLPIADFLDRLHREGRRIVRGSLVWLPHPTKKGRMVAAVRVEEINHTQSERNK